MPEGFAVNGKVRLDQIYNPDVSYQKVNNIRPNFNTDNESIFISNVYDRLLKIHNPIKDKQEGNNSNPEEGVPSYANRYVLFQYKGLDGKNLNAIDYHVNPNNIYLTNERYRLAKNPTATNIIEYFNNMIKEDGTGVSMTYSYADFLYCKYYGRIPNNYMITVRRFARPVVDNLWDPYVYDAQSGKLISNNQFDLARAITYLGETTGNKLEDILNFTFNYKWKEIESEMQVAQSTANGISGSPIFSALDFRVGGVRINAGTSFAQTGSGITAAQAAHLKENAGYDPIKETFPNYVEGPLNVIKNMIIRDRGLEFNHEFTLKFEYELRGIGDIHPKMALLDIMANILVLTYSNAPFWGGGHRFVGNGNFGSPLGNRELLKKGDIKGFIQSAIKDVVGMISNVFGDGKGGFSLSSFFKGLGDIAGNMLGGWLSENINTPQAIQTIQALLTGEPTGQWHVTIGNPLNPIAMIGNLTLQETKMNFVGPFSADDFPSGLVVEMTFKPGRPRDKSEIESMFNCGRGRLYHIPEGVDDFLNIAGKEDKKITGYDSKRTDKLYIDDRSGTGIGKNKKVVTDIGEMTSKASNLSTSDISEVYTNSKNFIAARFGNSSISQYVNQLYPNLSKMAND